MYLSHILLVAAIIYGLLFKKVRFFDAHFAMRSIADFSRLLTIY